MNDTEREAALFLKRWGGQKSRLRLPDFSRMNIELRKRHITRQLLWEEYRASNPDGYGYSQYCQLYKDWSAKPDISMRQTHKAGEKMFTDFPDSKARWRIHRQAKSNKSIFLLRRWVPVAIPTLRLVWIKSKQSVINAHIRAFEFYQGVTQIIVPDNLKSAVTKADKYDPELNQSFQDMAEHYGTVVIPARPYRPKDKPKVELSVKLVQRWILAQLRQKPFTACPIS